MCTRDARRALRAAPQAATDADLRQPRRIRSVRRRRRAALGVARAGDHTWGSRDAPANDSRRGASRKAWASARLTALAPPPARHPSAAAQAHPTPPLRRRAGGAGARGARRRGRGRRRRPSPLPPALSTSPFPIIPSQYPSAHLEQPAARGHCAARQRLNRHDVPCLRPPPQLGQSALLCPSSPHL